MTDLSSVIALLACVLVAVVVVWLTVSVGGGGAPEVAPTETDVAPDPVESHQRLAAVVVNPTKFDDLDDVKHRLDTLAAEHDWRIRWWETTVDDTGTGQTREALEADVDLVFALGGDGTVRAVAAGLLGSDVPIGLLPGGTGNLLARNLDLPIDSLEDSFVTALEGVDRRIDVGCLSTVPRDTQEEPKDNYFLVMAGLGFDAAVMAEAPEELKSRLGWGAYVVSGLRRLNGPRFETTVRFDDERTVHRKVRSIIIGNVGRLQGGVHLLPDAEADDGTLDAVLLAPKGLTGWAAVIARILTKTRHGHSRVEHFQCRSMRIDLAADHEEEVQLDGDPIGPATTLLITVLPSALLVRMGADTEAVDRRYEEPADRLQPSAADALAAG